MERLETEHWPCNPFDQAMILLNDIVEVLGLNDTDDPTNSCEFEDDIETLQAGQIGATLADHNTTWNTVCVNRPLEEPSRSGSIAVL